ncbi:MAG TPA: glycoside hydrolase family 15 protein [Pyrinomonadaceae bacterium]|nr:glycoside hydrolase family 15 protein [Pyrinomonadaceae bacterium]
MIRIALIIAFACQTVMAQSKDAHWATAAKNGFGTSTTLSSKVWFTLADGVMTEVFYPTLDLPNVQTLQLYVDNDGRTETEIKDTIHRLEIPTPVALTFRQVNTAKNGAYTITKTYITDPRNNTVLIDIDFNSRGNLNAYIHYDPSLNNSGWHDVSGFVRGALLATDKNVSSALMSNCEITALTSGTNSKPPANLVQIVKFDQKRCTVALAFGETTTQAVNAGRASLARGFEATRRDYEAGWERYVATLPRIAKHQRQFNMAAMVLRGLEDKTYRGAVIASPSTPWGGGPNANEPTTTGYHAVWARDLYHVATALDAMGDRAGANRLLDYLLNVQQEANGVFPQNSWVHGSPIGRALQLDQMAWPIILAYHLQRYDRKSWLDHIKPAADVILKHGPRTNQDRWEEKSGYSPATIAAQIAGLVCAADIATYNGERALAREYLETADNWTRNVEKWTVIKEKNATGHYIRITENDDPNDGAKMEINSSSLVVDERKIVDAGFLELVRLGIKSPRDPLIVESLKLIDQLIKVKTPVGDAWYRYNHDAYGETPDGGDYDARNGVGRLWTLLTGERGEYELATGNVAEARKLLDTMAGFANDGLMIPEQVWDRKESPTPSLRFGAGTGSATPLAWSMAQFIRLAMSIERGRNIERPRIVWERYGSRG